MKHSRREIFWTFFKFGFVTFGGGWSIVAQMQKEFVEKKRWINEEELLDFTSVGRSLPGLMIGNVSVLFGYRMTGFLGAAAALGGVVLPPFLIMIGVTALYGLVKDHPLAARAMAGVRAAVVPIILSALLKLFKAGMKDGFCYAVAVLGLALCLFTPVNTVLVVLLGAALGLIWMEGKHAVS